MPIYEYQCNNCAHCFEILVLGPSEQPPACPKCGEKDVNRRMSAACVISTSGPKACGPKDKGFT